MRDDGALVGPDGKEVQEIPTSWNDRLADVGSMFMPTAGGIAGLAKAPDEVVVGAGPIRAYHGSPHDFDKFSMEHIGKGEGNQAYGHGLYFTDTERVAQGYADKLSIGDRRFSILGPDGQSIPDNTPGVGAVKDFYYAYQGGVNRSDKRHIIGNWTRWAAEQDGKIQEYRDYIEKNPQHREWAQEAIADMERLKNEYLGAARILREGSGFTFKPNGHMYEVDIDADPEGLLHWDKPIAAQPKIKKALTEELEAMRELREKYNMNAPDPDKMKGEDYILGGSKRVLSKSLLEKGIPGVIYRDGFSRGTNGDSHNYVIWNDDLINIKRKYAKGGVVSLMKGNC